MLRLLFLSLVVSYSLVWSQTKLPMDSLYLKDARDFQVDDYGNLYVYKSKDFSLTKYDSVGKQLGKMMFTVPFRVQSVQNPLNIVLFSENAQGIKYVDQNLIEMQKLSFQPKFGFVRLAYAEDQQLLWLLDESSKTLIQYNFRNDSVLNSFPFDFNLDEVIDLLVYNNKVYLLSASHFRVFNFNFELLHELEMQGGKRLRRENDIILVMAKKNIFQYIETEEFKVLFSDEEAEIVDKNSTTYFALKDNNLYLYQPN